MGRMFWEKAAIFFHCIGVGLFPTLIPLEKSLEEETCMKFASLHLPWGIFPDIVPNSILFLRH